MKLNCKPGDLAVIIREGRGRDDLCGRIVEVIKAASKDRFELPDGFMQGPSEDSRPRWVCRFPNKVRVDIDIGGSRMAEYATAPDSALRPIRPEEGDDETLTWAGKPEKVTA